MKSQEAGDRVYKRLFVTALQDGHEEGGLDIAVDDILILDDTTEFSRHAWEDDAGEYFDNGAALAKAGSVPPYIVSAMMHCPNSLDGADAHHYVMTISDEREQELDTYPDAYYLLVLIADWIACEHWVIQAVLNHRGRILPC